MDATIKSVPNSYGFGHDWVLHVEGNSFVKNFYLGQDVKFIRRVLGVDPSAVIEAIGSNDLRNETTLQKLAHFIIMRLGLNEEELGSLQEWELCCQ